MHYYKRNIGDYHKKAGRLSMMEHGAYTLLMDACYDREEFPTKEQAIEWAWARTPDEIAAVEFVLSKFFTLEGGVYVQGRISDEIAKYQETSNINKRIAKEREEKRRAAANASSTNRERSVDEAPPNHKPRTNNHKPRTKKDNGASAPALVRMFSEFWDSWPSGFGDKGSRKNAEAQFLKLKPDQDLLSAMTRAVQRQFADKQHRASTGQFCPNFKHVERWLKNREWENEIEPQYAGKPSRADTIERALDEAFGPSERGVLEGDFQRVDCYAAPDES